MVRILLIKEREETRAGLRRLLESMGHEVVEARDGEEGMGIFRSMPVDIVVTDLMMQGFDGVGLVPELRRVNPHTGIIALHGGSRRRNDQLLALAKKYGARHTLIGSFDSKELFDAVNDCLKPRLH